MGTNTDSGHTNSEQRGKRARATRERGTTHSERDTRTGDAHTETERETEREGRGGEVSRTERHDDLLSHAPVLTSHAHRDRVITHPHMASYHHTIKRTLLCHFFRCVFLARPCDGGTCCIVFMCLIRLP